MPSRSTNALLSLEVPIVVRLAQRKMSLREVTQLMPGAIIELEKPSDDELELLINNVPVGFGSAVKVGENFGLRINFIGGLEERLQALAAEAANEDDAGPSDEELAEQLLEGQL